VTRSAPSIQATISVHTSGLSDPLWTAPGTRIRRFGPLSAANTRCECSGRVSRSRSPCINSTGALMRAAACCGLTSPVSKPPCASAILNARAIVPPAKKKGARSDAYRRQFDQHCGSGDRHRDHCDQDQLVWTTRLHALDSSRSAI